MAEEIKQPVALGYGFEDDNVKQSTFHFGGNFGVTKMIKFEYNTMSGKKDADGNPTAGESLDIVFNINGTDKSYRQFPVLKAFDENNIEVTDSTHPAFIKAQKNLNMVCVQIMKCFVDENDVKAALAKRVESFKDFVTILIGLLPKGFETKLLDVFIQWQYAISTDNDKTYLELPKKATYGRFLCAAVAPLPAGSEWKEVKTATELKYVDSVGNTHPFVRGEWFVNSAFFTQQKEGGETTNALNTSTGGTTGATTSTPSW